MLPPGRTPLRSGDRPRAKVGSEDLARLACTRFDRKFGDYKGRAKRDEVPIQFDNLGHQERRTIQTHGLLTHCAHRIAFAHTGFGRHRTQQMFEVVLLETAVMPVLVVDFVNTQQP